MIFCFIFKFLKIKEKFKNELLGLMTLFEVGETYLQRKIKNWENAQKLPTIFFYLLENEVEISRNTNLIPLT